MTVVGDMTQAVREAPGSTAARPASLRNMFLAAGGVTLVLLAGKIAGVAEKILVARTMGTSRSADCYYAAFAVTWTLAFVVLELVQASCLPVYVGILQAGDRRRADRLVSALAIILTATLLACMAAVALWPQALVAIMVPGFDAPSQAETARLLRAMSVGTGILALMGLTRTTLNARRHFAWAAVGELAFRAGYVGLFALGWLVWHGNYAGTALAAAATLALLVHAAALRGIAGLRPSWPDRQLVLPLRQIAMLTMPLIAGVVSSHVSQILDGVLASLLPPGRLSALTYARKLTDAIVLLGPAALATVTFSHFASLAAKGSIEQMRRQLWCCVRIVLAASVPIALLVMLLCVPIVRILFERGRFDAASTHVTSAALSCYALGIPALALDGLIVSTFYACRNMRTPVVAGVIAAVTNVLVAYLLLPSLGHLAIALSLVITKSIKVAALGLVLHRRPIVGASVRSD